MCGKVHGFFIMIDLREPLGFENKKFPPSLYSQFAPSFSHRLGSEVTCALDSSARIVWLLFRSKP